MAQLTSHQSARRKTLTRTGYALAAACWPASLTVWLLHISHTAFTGQRTLALVFTWLIATGCLGVPVAGLRVLGPRLTASMCRSISAFCFGACVLLTIVYADGQLHPTVASLYATLIMPMAVGIQAFNANRALDNECDAYEDGHEAGSFSADDAPGELLALLRDREPEQILALSDALRDYATRALADSTKPRSRRGEDCHVHLVRDDETARHGAGA